jgi:hypothetical protein
MLASVKIFTCPTSKVLQEHEHQLFNPMQRLELVI